jgi:hypothetical protein
MKRFIFEDGNLKILMTNSLFSLKKEPDTLVARPVKIDFSDVKACSWLIC